jgi:hypothetical protein
LKRILLLGFLFAACGPDAKFKSACQKIKINICNHQVECGIEPDNALCQRQFDEDYICDPEATIDELKVCSDAALTLECPRATPFVCFDVLCDASSGCSEPVGSTTGDTSIVEE